MQADLAATDIDSLCQQCLDTQELMAKLKYHVFDIDSAVSDESSLSFYNGVPNKAFFSCAKQNMFSFVQLKKPCWCLNILLIWKQCPYAYMLKYSSPCPTQSSLFLAL